MKLDHVGMDTIEAAIRRLETMVAPIMVESLEETFEPVERKKPKTPKAKKPKINWNGSPFAAVRAATDPEHPDHDLIMKDARSHLLGTMASFIENEKARAEKKAKEKEKNEVVDFFAALDSL